MSTGKEVATAATAGGGDHGDRDSQDMSASTSGPPAKRTKQVRTVVLNRPNRSLVE